MDRRDVQLPPVWVQDAHAPQSTVQTEWIARADANPEQHAGGPVLIMLAAPSEATLQSVLAYGQAGARVYVLAPSSWQPKDRHLVRCPTVLIRRTSEGVPASGLHTPNRAFVWMGDRVESTPWKLWLDEPQAVAFRQVFLRLFWHEAKDEAYSGGKQFSFRQAGARPFDVPEPLSTAPICLVSEAALPTPNDGLLHLTQPRPPTGKPSCLWMPPTGTLHRPLSSLLEAGASVRWQDRALPEFATDGQSGTILLPGAQERLHIKLNPEQANDAAALLEESGLWSFRGNVRLGDHADDGSRIWLSGAPEAKAVEPEQVLPMPSMLASSLRATHGTTPDDWPTPHPLALTARYTWSVVPPRVPTGSKEDPLIGLWRKLDTQWTDRLAKVENALKRVDGERGRIGRALSRLVSAMLGFERSQRTLTAEVETLRGLLPSASGPHETPALLERLARLEADAQALQTDLDETERQGREDEEREEQRLKWRQGVEDAQRTLPTRRAELTEAQDKGPELQLAIEQLASELESAKKKARQNIDVQLKKRTDEQTRLDRRTRRLQDEIVALQRTIEDPFEFKPRARRGSRKNKNTRFVPPSTSRAVPSVPDEALPEVGLLRHHKNQRYLVIARWDDVDLGEQVAERLKAQLVAPENI
jgi:hypothetical protein